MMRILFWKEWREQRWRLAFGSVLLAAFAAIGLRSRMIPDEGVFAIAILIGCFGLPLLTAMAVTGSERAEGSLDHLLALPVPAWKTLLVKLAVAALNCVGPLAAALAVSLVYARGREFSLSLTVWGFAAGMWMAVNLLVWTAALGVGQPNEARVGVAGLVVLALWSFYMFILEFSVWGSTERLLASPDPIEIFVWLDNFSGNLPFGRKALELALILSSQSLILVALFAWTLKRLRRIAAAKV